MRQSWVFGLIFVHPPFPPGITGQLSHEVFKSYPQVSTNIQVPQAQARFPTFPISCVPNLVYPAGSYSIS